jgi:catechol 2,3-dioxygenase-like lactoylglutathione lyase family enzyme
MKRTYMFAAALAITLVVALVPVGSQSPAGVRFDEFAPTTFSVVTRDAQKLSAAWADVLGITAPKVNRPQVTYPPVFEGDRASRPTMASLQSGNMSISMHQPPPGTYWHQILSTHGQLLYRMNFRVHGLATQTAYFEGKGGKLVIGDPAKVPYVNVNLWPKYGVALELNGVADDAPAPGPKPAPPAGSFATNPVSKIAFVVPDLDAAIRDYRDLFGLPEPTTGTTPPLVFPAGLKVDRQTTIKWAKFTFPNGVILELNEPRGGSSIWRDHLDKHGRSIFSVGFRVKSVRDQVAYLTSKGGTLAFGGPAAGYAGLDLTSRLGLVVELQQ